MTETIDHKWPTNPQGHVWTQWLNHTGPPKATQYRSCVHPNCKEIEIKESSKA